MAHTAGIYLPTYWRISLMSSESPPLEIQISQQPKQTAEFGASTGMVDIPYSWQK
jgi:hypothetical protein